jgi:pSer/pThr/pTyr-binding forkhead associated (FHA) protein
MMKELVHQSLQKLHGRLRDWSDKEPENPEQARDLDLVSALARAAGKDLTDSTSKGFAADAFVRQGWALLNAVEASNVNQGELESWKRAARVLAFHCIRGELSSKFEEPS